MRTLVGAPPVAWALLVACVLLAAIGCSRDQPAPAAASTQSPPAATTPPARVDASDLIATFQCNRCHEIANVAAAPRNKHCVACHQQIHAGTFEVNAAQLAKWQARITSVRWVPSLVAADRLRRSWVREFLLAPHDVRPGLIAQMPRLALTPADADRLAAHLTATDAQPVAADMAGDSARGEQLFRALACGRCHRFTGASVDDEALHAAGKTQGELLAVSKGGGARADSMVSWALAPDLRYARARMEPAAIATWIVEPRGVMPRLAVTQADALALAAYIVTTPLAELAPRTPPQRLPVLTRAVTFDEVEAKVFRNVCWHCHAVPDFARGDGGPGNTGGFGFAPRGLDVTSYAAISAGSLDDAGEPRSIFAPLPDGTPRLVAHLLARHTEEAGGSVPGVRGMPLGLPALPLEEIQLVDTWIAQGRPR